MAVSFGPATVVFAEGDSSYRLGVEAFRAGDFARALEGFEAAERAGSFGARVEFNLGSTLFKLGRYDESRARFERIANDPDWGALALYNLGLIAEREYRGGDARAYFEAVLQRAPGQHVSELARRKLESVAVVAPPSARWTGFVSFAGGWDDNVVLSEDPAVVEVSDQEDAFVDLLLSGSRRLSGTDAGGLRIDLNAFGEAYRDLDDFNVASLSPALVWNGAVGDWSFDPSIGVDADFIGSNYYAATTTLRLRAAYPLGVGSAARFRIESSWISGATDYEYVTGWRERLGVEIQSRLSIARVRAGYVLELNDRDDFANGGDFASYSPTRHGFFVAALQEPARWLRVEARLEYRLSDYSDPNRTVETDGSVVVDERDEDRFIFGVRSSFAVSHNLALFVDYAYANNDVNLSTYEYAQNRVMLGVEATY